MLSPIDSIDPRSPLFQEPTQSFATRIVMAVVLASFASILLASATIVYEAYRSARQSIAAAQGTVLHSALIEASRILDEASRDLTEDRYETFVSVSEVPVDNDGELLHPEDDIRSWPAHAAFEGLETVEVVSWLDPSGRHGLGVVATRGGAELRGLLPADHFSALSGSGSDFRVSITPSPEPSAGPLGELRIERDASGRYQAMREETFVSGWVARVEQPFAKAFTPIFALSVRIFAIDCLLLALVGIGAYLFARRVVAPIEDLTEDARRIARGTDDLEIVERGSTWEVRVLSRSIRDMAQALFRQHNDLEDANARLRMKNEELQAANEVLEQLSITDGLTKLHNHRFFQEQLTREIKRADRTNDPLSILVCDLDDFKALNDRRGHKAGDDLLKGLARILSESVRESDFLARYGGEEFVILAAQTELDGAIRLAEKIRTTVEDASFIMDGSPRPGRSTLSIGVAQYRGSRTSFFRAADQALYRAKASGKNCVVAEDRDAP